MELLAPINGLVNGFHRHYSTPIDAVMGPYFTTVFWAHFEETAFLSFQNAKAWGIPAASLTPGEVISRNFRVDKRIRET